MTAVDSPYRHRAAAAMTARMETLRTNAAGVARAAGVDPKTIRAVLAGRSWPRSGTRARIEAALGWPEGELTRRAAANGATIENTSTLVLLAEVCRRVEAGDC